MKTLTRLRGGIIVRNDEVTGSIPVRSTIFSITSGGILCSALLTRQAQGRTDLIHFSTRSASTGCSELKPWSAFNALGVEFVSLSEQMDTSTPAGRMVLTVLGAVAELERSLIAERVRAGLRNARAKGKRLGRPRVYADASHIAALRSDGASWADITAALGVSKGTAQRAFYALPKGPAVAAVLGG